MAPPSSIIGLPLNSLVKRGRTDFLCTIHDATPLKIQNALTLILGLMLQLDEIGRDCLFSFEWQAWKRSVIGSVVSYFQIGRRTVFFCRANAARKYPKGGQSLWVETRSTS
jgi:hypothetical protein